MTMTLNGSGTGTVGVPNSAVAQNATGTAIDFTGIPAGTKRITVMFNGVSTNGSSPVQIQIGSGSLTTSGYNSLCEAASTGVGSTSSTTGLLVSYTSVAAERIYGSATICLIGSNTWVESGTLIRLGSPADGSYMSGGAIALSGVLDRVRITTVNGTDTFDAGSINILYE